MYDEDDLLPISGLQHLVFCRRQWALIHLERVWAENRLTADGRERHSHVHEQVSDTRSGVRTVRGLPVRSLQLGLSGVCDAVEFPLSGGDPSEAGGEFDWGISERRPCPPAGGAPLVVEYKRGKPKPTDCDRVQLCAQALCLEEMIGVRMTEGALFYWETRRREAVELTAQLRDETRRLAAEMQRLYCDGTTPPAVATKGCKSCSLRDICLPAVTGAGKSARRYMEEGLRRSLQDGPS